MKWGSLKRIQKVCQHSTSGRAYHATRHCERTPWSSFVSPSTSRRMHEQIRETVTNYFSLSPATAADGKALTNLKRRSCTEPHLWSTMSKPRMTRELSAFLHHKKCIGSLIGYSMVGSGKASFCSQARAVAETLKQEGSRGAKLAMDSRKFGQKKSEEMLMYLVAMVVAMVGMTYAAVPLYRKFCQATGYGGTVQRREYVVAYTVDYQEGAVGKTVEEKIARHKAEESAAVRELVVQFNADVADGMPWKFTPSQREVRVRPGQSTLAFYTAENNSNTPITGVSTYNVSPMKAGIYFNKIQCFCFEEQRLLPGEKIDMPVFFYIDPEFATDPKMDGINSLILSYTFFKVEDAPQQT